MRFFKRVAAIYKLKAERKLIESENYLVGSAGVICKQPKEKQAYKEVIGTVSREAKVRIHYLPHTSDELREIADLADRYDASTPPLKEVINATA